MSRKVSQRLGEFKVESTGMVSLASSIHFSAYLGIPTANLTFRLGNSRGGGRDARLKTHRISASKRVLILSKTVQNKPKKRGREREKIKTEQWLPKKSRPLPTRHA
ncbi:hypothetical protein AA313_de0201434 [Arthrobotrys entomopaga]|nr:hypothetical protein AA313_de0201434 [Arthrobotrys entomopaga]